MMWQEGLGLVCLIILQQVVLVRVSGHVFNKMRLASLLTLRLFLMFSLIEIILFTIF